MPQLLEPPLLYPSVDKNQGISCQRTLRTTSQCGACPSGNSNCKLRWIGVFKRLIRLEARGWSRQRGRKTQAVNRRGAVSRRKFTKTVGYPSQTHSWCRRQQLTSMMRRDKALVSPSSTASTMWKKTLLFNRARARNKFGTRSSTWRALSILESRPTVWRTLGTVRVTGTAGTLTTKRVFSHSEGSRASPAISAKSLSATCKGCSVSIYLLSRTFHSTKCTRSQSYRVKLCRTQPATWPSRIRQAARMPCIETRYRITTSSSTKKRRGRKRSQRGRKIGASTGINSTRWLELIAKTH